MKRINLGKKPKLFRKLRLALRGWQARQTVKIDTFKESHPDRIVIDPLLLPLGVRVVAIVEKPEWTPRQRTLCRPAGNALLHDP